MAASESASSRDLPETIKCNARRCASQYSLALGVLKTGTPGDRESASLRRSGCSSSVTASGPSPAHRAGFLRLPLVARSTMEVLASCRTHSVTSLALRVRTLAHEPQSSCSASSRSERHLSPASARDRPVRPRDGHRSLSPVESWGLIHTDVPSRTVTIPVRESSRLSDSPNPKYPARAWCRRPRPCLLFNSVRKPRCALAQPRGSRGPAPAPL